jgi:hypothetical protein
VHVPGGWYKPLDTMWARKPFRVTRMPQNISLSLGRARNDLMLGRRLGRLHQINFSSQQHLKYQETSLAYRLFSCSHSKIFIGIVLQMSRTLIHEYLNTYQNCLVIRKQFSDINMMILQNYSHTYQFSNGRSTKTWK